MKPQPQHRKPAKQPVQPAYYAYTVKEASGGDAYWTKIGAVFTHEDGEGATLILDALPIADRIVLRTPKLDA